MVLIVKAWEFELHPKTTKAERILLVNNKLCRHSEQKKSEFYMQPSLGLTTVGLFYFLQETKFVWFLAKIFYTSS